MAGIPGEAYLDTGAVTSVASASLHAALQESGIRSRKQSIETILADGRKTLCELDTYLLPVELEGRTPYTDFIVLPDSRDNRTLLGCDFIEDIGAVVNTPQRHWYFIDEPERKLNYYRPSSPWPNRAEIPPPKPGTHPKVMPPRVAPTPPPLRTSSPPQTPRVEEPSHSSQAEPLPEPARAKGQPLKPNIASVNAAAWLQG